MAYFVHLKLCMALKHFENAQKFCNWLWWIFRFHPLLPRLFYAVEWDSIPKSKASSGLRMPSHWRDNAVRTRRWGRLGGRPSWQRRRHLHRRHRCWGAGDCSSYSSMPQLRPPCPAMPPTALSLHDYVAVCCAVVLVCRRYWNLWIRDRAAASAGPSSRGR